MKWLSIKKYKPLYYQDVFILSQKDGHNSFHIGRLNNVDQWDAHTYLIQDVTHFCIPDPIEIEEE